jgi:hypothetical protein
METAMSLVGALKKEIGLVFDRFEVEDGEGFTRSFWIWADRVEFEVVGDSETVRFRDFGNRFSGEVIAGVGIILHDDDDDSTDEELEFFERLANAATAV